MISILIPVYNFNINDLIRELTSQGEKSGSPFEIIVIDDASTNKDQQQNNSKISKYKYTLYIENETNIGRSATRNLLAEKAKYEYLLFMDGDSQIENSDYLKKYFESIKEYPKDTIICGGTSYTHNPPDNQNHLLRWVYGKAHEEKSAQQRNLNPNGSFSAFNFLISKSLFDHIKFDNSIKQYGHEDTLLGYKLKKAGFTIKHIDNPLTHIGLESSNIFIEKTIIGVNNLKELYKRFYKEKKFIEDIKLLKTYHKLRKYRSCWIVSIFYKIFKKFLTKNLTGSKPKMFYFKLLKLGQICCS
ncbi:MAG: glycosyltransferase family 2 protein [Bacteroidales bacterium]|nr:glycosyltransferase family 2 protein [Bacteroidales bacterium]